MCINGECISQSLYCNDALNCSDGSDEINCRSEFGSYLMWGSF